MHHLYNQVSAPPTQGNSCCSFYNQSPVSTLCLTLFRAMPKERRKERWLLHKEAQMQNCQIHRATNPNKGPDRSTIKQVHSFMLVQTQNGDQLFLTKGLKYFVLEIGIGGKK